MCRRLAVDVVDQLLDICPGDPPITESIDDMSVVHDLMMHVYLLTGTDVEQLIDDIDGHKHARTETSWIGENDLHRGWYSLSL